MKAIQHHLYALKVTFETLSKGKFLLFFLPGIIVGLIYLLAYDYTTGINTAAESTKDVWLFGGFLSGVLSWAAGFLQAILLFVFQFFVLTLLSPFNTVLSEKFDTELTGRQFEGGFVRILNDFLRMILVVILSLVLELFFMLIAWILPFGVLDPLVYFLIGSFFFGFAFYDFSLERHGVGTFGSLGFSFKKLWHMVITGALFQLIFMIPVAGIILAPVLMTMISTAVYVKMHQKPASPPETL
jgi:CysZ protein